MGLELLHVVEGDANLAEQANDVATGDRGHLSADLFAETKLDPIPKDIDPRIKASAWSKGDGD